MTAKQLIDLLHFLGHFKKWPGNYLGTPNIDEAQTFLAGFDIALYFTFGWDSSRFHKERERIMLARGWHSITARSPHHEMVECGMSTEQVIGELIEIESDCIRAMFANDNPK